MFINCFIITTNYKFSFFYFDYIRSRRDESPVRLFLVSSDSNIGVSKWAQLVQLMNFARYCTVTFKILVIIYITNEAWVQKIYVKGQDSIVDIIVRRYKKTLEKITSCS